MELSRLFSPRGIAVVGASNNPKKFGGLTLENIVKSGYDGYVAPVNPTKDEIMGLPAFNQVSDIPMPIDVAVLAVPKRHVESQILDCAKAKVQFLLIMTGGFGETGEIGKSEQAEMVKLARDNGMRVVGLNLLGLGSTPSKLLMNASLAMREVAMREGTISMVSQSGSTMGILYNRGAREGVRFRHVIAIGNQADIEIADFVEFYAEDPGTTVVLASIEGLKNSQRFFAAARRCQQLGKPLIVVKTGRTQHGARVATTHTGSLATAYEGFAARCEEVGIILVEDDLTMARLGAVYAKYGDPGSARGVALLSPSGGAIAQATDRLSEKGMELADFGPETVMKLETLYVEGMTSNPLDFANLHDNSFLDVGDGGASIVAEDPNVAVIVGVLGTTHNLDEMVTDMASSVGTRIPLSFAVLPGSNGDRARHAAAEFGLLAVDSIDDCLNVFRLWMQSRPIIFPSPERPNGIENLAGVPELAAGVYGEFETKRLLAGHGIAVTREAKAATVEQAVKYAEEIGYPVVLKGFGAGLNHKSESGAVKLNLTTVDVLRGAWDEIRKSTRDALEGCVVAQMVKGEAELLVGAYRCPDFGPMIMFGAGGVLAEFLGDVATLPAPAHRDSIRAKLMNLKISGVLGGLRGRQAADVDAAVDAIFRLGWFVADAGNRLQELDINPLIVRKDGDGAIVVDARMRLEDLRQSE
ncbi:MAG: hypothetical protein CME05_15535 [Gemmatimonadaceae bacterium]|nr:hypothetical protein [Gemmatimonadaceae bacterium]